ncbi:olfactory receptor 1019-like [Spea bombifrons]|uniref:olfactory receptor 1019-like n=1 Tax=Spea bombifrons TaxID=233779 RepID=UPI0023495147|nr:olfactory receptor 1019-like [Spea bombifrons]
MEGSNQTSVTYFIIKGISEVPGLQIPIFILVLLILLLTLGGNVTIVLLVCLERQLHTPMYFFLCNLAVLNMCSSTVTSHKILVIFVSGHNTVPFLNCILQFYVFSSLACNELLILTAMGFDRYVAICKPLHYQLVMNPRACVLLASACWTLGFLEVVPYVALLSTFSCYTSNAVNHFFCDLKPLMNLSCSDTSVLEMLSLIEGLLLLSLTPFLLTFISYVFIIVAIMKIQSKDGRRKAFYTCSSHLTVVILLYVTLVCQYLRPTSGKALDSNKLFSLFNTTAVPMLNPLIYSLKNKDVTSALRRRFHFCKVGV